MDVSTIIIPDLLRGSVEYGAAASKVSVLDLMNNVPSRLVARELDVWHGVYALIPDGQVVFVPSEADLKVVVLGDDLKD